MTALRVADLARALLVGIKKIIVSNYHLELTVLSLNYFPRTLNKMEHANPVHLKNNSKVGDPFYSILIKHQLNMIQAWNPPGGSVSAIDTFSLSKALLKLKGFNSELKIQPATNFRNVLKSYETAKKMGEKGSLNKPTLKELSAQVAESNSIPSRLFQKLIHTESGFNPKALSSRGAMGLGQIMPDTARELGLSFGDDKTPGSVWHAESNLDASARYFKMLYDKYRKEGISDNEAWNFAAGAYNAGMGNIGKAIKKVSHRPVTTWDQVAKVLPEVTGKHSQETIRYVDRLRA